RLELAGAARHPQKDAVALLFPQLVGKQADAVEPVHAGQRRGARGRSPQKAPPGHRAVRIHAHIHASSVFAGHGSHFLIRNSVVFNKPQTTSSSASLRLPTLAMYRWQMLSSSTVALRARIR